MLYRYPHHPRRVSGKCIWMLIALFSCKVTSAVLNYGKMTNLSLLNNFNSLRCHYFLVYFSSHLHGPINHGLATAFLSYRVTLSPFYFAVFQDDNFINQYRPINIRCIFLGCSLCLSCSAGACTFFKGSDISMICLIFKINDERRKQNVWSLF